MDVGERIARGDRAKTLLESDVFQAVAREVSADLKNRTFSTLMDATSEREALYAEYMGFKAVIRRLKKWRDDGKIAQAELAREKSE